MPRLGVVGCNPTRHGSTPWQVLSSSRRIRDRASEARPLGSTPSGDTLKQVVGESEPLSNTGNRPESAEHRRLANDQHEAFHGIADGDEAGVSCATLEAEIEQLQDSLRGTQRARGWAHNPVDASANLAPATSAARLGGTGGPYPPWWWFDSARSDRRRGGGSPVGTPARHAGGFSRGGFDSHAPHQ